MEKKIIAGILLIITIFGITSGYTNSNYKKGIFCNKRLIVFPAFKDSLKIVDTTMIDFLVQDFSVTKADAFGVLDSLLTQCISKAFLHSSDNIKVIPFPAEIKNGSTLIFKSLDIVTNVSSKDRRLLKRLGIAIPSMHFLSSIGCSTDFGLFISSMDLDISYDVNITSTGSANLNVASNTRYEFDADNVRFVIWDYAANRIVCVRNVDAEGYYPRCEQLDTIFMKVDLGGCNDRISFWPHLLFPIGSEIAKATPFSKIKIGHSLGNEQWVKMKTIQLADPKRDPLVIAEKLNQIYPNVKTGLSRIDSFLGNRAKIKLCLTIGPNGHVFSVSVADSKKLDSSTSAGLKSDFDMQICDSIENSRLYTSVTLLIDRKNIDNPIKVEQVKNIEVRSKESIMQIVSSGVIKIDDIFSGFGLYKSGEIIVKFSIDENGDVCHYSIVLNTINNEQLDFMIMHTIRSLKFGKSYNPGATEVVCPIFFSDGSR